jgi:hypothetical protein
MIIDKIIFVSPINRETIYNETSLGTYESTMELWYDESDDDCSIEWNIEDLMITEQMQIQLDEGTKIVTGYDGVFELPKQAIELLNKNGFNTEEVE